jgi:hypothetical protein
MIETFKVKRVFTLIFLLLAFTIFSAEKETQARIKELEQKLNKLAGQEKVDLLNDLGKQYQDVVLR